MKLKEKGAHYSLIETSQTEIDLSGDNMDTETVYSALALYRENDYISSQFVYDISRDKEQAEYLLAAMRHKKPSKNELYDFISELL